VLNDNLTAECIIFCYYEWLSINLQLRDGDLVMQLKSGMLTFILCVVGSTNTYAECKPLPFMQTGFNMANYQLCQSLVSQCPKQGPVLNQACVDEAFKKNKACEQLKNLTETLHGNVSSISVEQLGKLALIENTFVADGQHNYYVLSSDACLIDTNTDPFNLNPALKEQYKHMELVFVNWSKPTFQSQPNGTQSVTSLLKVTKNCRACEIIGWAKIRFDFNKAGKYINTKLLSFTPNQSPST